MAPDIDSKSMASQPTIHSVAELLIHIRRERKPNARMYYRGEAQDHPTLSPKIFRNDRLLRNESSMLSDLMRERPDDFREARTSFSQWMIAQHHGLPTRFLDVSRNPLVALFFACDKGPIEDGRLICFSFPEGSKSLITSYDHYPASLIANYAKLTFEQKEEFNNPFEIFRIWNFSNLQSRPPPEGPLMPWFSKFGKTSQSAGLALHDLVRNDQPLENRSIFVMPMLAMMVGYLSTIVVVEPPQTLERVRAQSSAFITSGLIRDFADPENYEYVDMMREVVGWPHYPTYVSVAKASKQEILNELEMLGITEKSLFPGLDTSAKEITRGYLSGCQ